MQKEPLITAGTITTLVAAILVFLREMGVDITDAQQDAIRNLVAVLAPIILALIARQFVWSPDSVKEAVTAVSGSPTVAESVVKAGGATDASIVYTDRNDT